MKTILTIVFGIVTGAAAVSVYNTLNARGEAEVDATALSTVPPAVSVVDLAESNPAGDFSEVFPVPSETDSVLSVADLSQPPSGAGQREAALAAFRALGGTDAALERIAETIPKENRLGFRVDALTIQAETDARHAIRGALNLDTDVARRVTITRLAKSLALIDPIMATAQASQIEDSELRGEYLSGVAGAWAEVDPEATLRWLETNVPSNLRAEDAFDALRVIAESGGSEVLGNGDRLPAALQRTARKALIVALIADRPVTSIAMLESLDPGGDQRDLERLVGEAYAHEDVKAALSWARTLRDPRSAIQGVIRGSAVVDFERTVDLLVDEFFEADETQAPDRTTEIIIAINALMDSGAGDFSRVADRLFASDAPALEEPRRTMMLLWPQRDAKAALEWSLKNFAVMSQSDVSAVAGFAGRAYPELAMAALDQVPSDYRDMWLQSAISGASKADLDGALALLRRHQDSSIYTSAIGSIVEDLASSDPAAGVALLRTLKAPDLYRRGAAFATKWANYEPAAAAAWASRIEDPRLRTDAVVNVTLSWSNADPDSTLSWLLTLPDADVRDAGLSKYLATTSTTGVLDVRALRAVGENRREEAALGAIVSMGRTHPTEAQGLIYQHILTPTLQEEAERQLSRQTAGRASRR